MLAWLKKYFAHLIAFSGLIVAAHAMGATPNLGVDSDTIRSFLGEAASNQITQAGFFFTLAAWLHSGRVKKEIKLNFIDLTSAINNVAESLREDLKNHSNRLDNLTNRVKNVENNLKIKQE